MAVESPSVPNSPNEAATGVPRSAKLSLGIGVVCCLGLFSIAYTAGRNSVRDDINRLANAVALLIAIIIGIVAGHLAVRRIGHVKGLAGAISMLGLAVNYFGLLAGLFVCVLFFHFLQEAETAQRESYAVAAIHTIVEMENLELRCNISDLRKRDPATEAEVSRAENAGYNFELKCAQGVSTGSRFQIVATPGKPGETNARTFCSDEFRIVRYTLSRSETCGATSTPLR